MVDQTLYPLIDKAKWAKRYSLKEKSSKCRNCGKLLTANVPFATGDWRGFVSESHECGKEYDLIVATKSTNKERAGLVSSFWELSCYL